MDTSRKPFLTVDEQILKHRGLEIPDEFADASKIANKNSRPEDWAAATKRINERRECTKMEL